MEYCRATKADGSKALQYYEQAVVISRVGDLIIEVERVLREKAECTTALALFRKMDTLYSPTWTDVLIFDACYAMANIINYAIAANKNVVIRLKQANYHIACQRCRRINKKQDAGCRTS